MNNQQAFTQELTQTLGLAQQEVSTLKDKDQKLLMKKIAVMQRIHAMLVQLDDIKHQIESNRKTKR